MEGLYRNRREHVAAFLRKNHGDQIKIYNLCAEKKYQYELKAMKGLAMGRFPFCDHNVCDLKKVFDFCLDASLFLQQMEQLNKLKDQ